jgi:cell division transport system ATP-binding protein
MLEFFQVYKQHANKVHSLMNVSFRIPQGQMLFITGHSGAGKSTLLKMMARLDTATSGRVSLKRRDLAKISAQAMPFYRRQLGLIFQDHKLLNGVSVFDNVALPLKIIKMRSTDIPGRVRAALAKVGIYDKLQLTPEVLSAGEQQRVGIARAVVHRPAIILADEPTGNLDPALSREIIAMLAEFNRFGATVIVATHDESLLNISPDARILTLNKGKLIFDSHAR